LSTIIGVLGPTTGSRFSEATSNDTVFGGFLRVADDSDGAADARCSAFAEAIGYHHQ
jgi:hypothetical protein